MVDFTHEFGGQHTEIKLALVEKYLKAYAAALRRHFDQIWYIDAFAGTGSRTVRVKAREGDLLDEPVPEHVEHRRGSAQIAIDVEPRFDRLIFMDQKRSHVSALNELRARYSDRNISVLKGDANTLITSEINRSSWKGTRAVMFLDPYGMEVDWSTLEAIARTHAIDVWYLFPLSGLYRQAARDISKVDESKERAITRMLGTEAWKAELYSEVPRTMSDLLDGSESLEVRQRNADVAGLEAYVKRRLRDIFPLVLDPFPLPPLVRPQKWSLFCAISNPSEKATTLASKFGNHILSSGRSSHRRSR